MKRFQEAFKGSDKFYLADPEKVTIKKNDGQRGGEMGRASSRERA